MTTLNWPTPAQLADELLSGRYVKGQGALLSSITGTDKYCCLGVCGAMAGLTSAQLGGRALLSGLHSNSLHVHDSMPDWLIYNERFLAETNDDNVTWDRVVEILRGLS